MSSVSARSKKGVECVAAWAWIASFREDYEPCDKMVKVRSASCG